MVIQRLPQFAEHHFAACCASAGVVCNASDQDECGWDFFVQFPARRRQALSADMQVAGPEALVQVKSTRQLPHIARMKLSNALRAAQAPQPYFVVLVVPGADDPQIYARHFWEPEITHSLRRVRAAERDGDPSLNRRHFAIRMTDADAHNDDLLEWMRATIEGVKPNYAEAKTNIFKSVGHEDGFGSLKVTFAGPSDDFLKLQLGLVESIPIARAQYVSQRFGIEAARPEIDLEDVRLFVTPAGKPCRLRLQGGSPTAELFVDATIYSAESSGDQPRHLRWRVDAGPLRILGGGDDCSAGLTVGYGDRRPLAELILFLTLAVWQGGGTVGLQLFIDNQKIPLGALTFAATQDRLDWKDLQGWAEALHLVATASQDDMPTLSLLDFYEARIWLARFAGFVAATSIRIEYEPLSLDDPTRAAIYYVGCDVGDWCFLAVIERNTRTDEMHDERRSLTFGASRILDAIVRRGSWRDHRAEIERAYRAQVERLGEPESLWELNELEEFVAKMVRSTA